jgi:outer membrane immunogenic protein
VKRISACMLALLALLIATPWSSTKAADLPYKAPPPVPWYDWTGFYIGLNGGYSWGNSSTNFTGAGVTPFSTSQSMDGWLGGGQIGYNWQYNRNWLLGVEADIQGTGQRGSAVDPSVTTGGCPVGVNCIAALPLTVTSGTSGQSLPWFGTARLRLGVEPTDHWLLYITGGLAFGEVDSTETISATTSGTVTTVVSNANNTRLGWTVGGGSEWVLTGAWTAKLEYLYMDFGTFTDTFTGTGAYSSLTASSHVTDNILRVGLNYHFH